MWELANTTALTLSTDNQGITVSTAPITRPLHDAATGDRIAHLCLQAKDGDRLGPWVMTSAQRARKQAPPS